MEMKMLKTLIMKVQNDETLTQEEKDKRINLLEAWRERYGKELIKVNNKIEKIISKNKPHNIKFSLTQWKCYHWLKLSYYGIDRQDIVENLINSTEKYDLEYVDNILKDDANFIKELFRETIEQNNIFPEF